MFSSRLMMPSDCCCLPGDVLGQISQYKWVGGVLRWRPFPLPFPAMSVRLIKKLQRQWARVLLGRTSDVDPSVDPWGGQESLSHGDIAVSAEGCWVTEAALYIQAKIQHFIHSASEAEKDILPLLLYASQWSKVKNTLPVWGYSIDFQTDFSFVGVNSSYRL